MWGGAGCGGGHAERDQPLNQLLACVHGSGPHADVIVVSAATRPDVRGPARMRPGRYVREVLGERPAWRARS